MNTTTVGKTSNQTISNNPGIEGTKKFIGMRSCPDYHFQIEKNGYNEEDTLLDCVAFFTMQTEVYHQLGDDEDFKEELKSRPSGDPFLRFLNIRNTGSVDGIKSILTQKSGQDRLTEFLSFLSISMNTYTLLSCDVEEAPESFSQFDLVKTLLQEYSGDEVSEDDNNLSAVLIRLLYRDLIGFETEKTDGENKLEILRAKQAQLKPLILQKNSPTHFIKFLNRLVFNDRPDNIEFDDLGEALIGSNKAYFLRLLNSTQPKNYIEKADQESDFNLAWYKRFDMTHSLSFGMVDLNMEVLMNYATRILHFTLPSGKFYALDHQSILCDMNIAGITDTPEYRGKFHFKTPSVLDSVTLLEQKENFLTVDYDWIMLSLNIYHKGINWALHDEEQFQHMEGQSNWSVFVGYSNKFNNLETALKIPIFTKSGQIFKPEMKSGNYSDCFITENELDTVKDLLKYINEKFEKTEIADITYNKLSFVRIDETIEYSPLSEDELLTDVLKKVNSNKLAEDIEYSNSIELRLIPFFCSLRSSPNINPEKQSNSKVKVKSNLTNFFDFLYNMSFDQYTHIDPCIDFYLYQPASYWLPKYLIVNVTKISSSLIDPKSELSLELLKDSVSKMGSIISTDYEITGLICHTSASERMYYPICVNWLKKTCTGYLGEKKEFRLRALTSDNMIHYVFLQRKVFESE